MSFRIVNIYQLDLSFGSNFVLNMESVLMALCKSMLSLAMIGKMFSFIKLMMIITFQEI